MKKPPVLVAILLLLGIALAPAQPTPTPTPPQPQIVPPGAPVTASIPAPAPQPTPSEQISLTFPRAQATDILRFYENLTGKRIIRDSNLAGNELSIEITKPVPKEDAIAIIESTLLMNNYSIVPVDENTIKILGPSRAPRTEGLPLFNALDELPSDGDKIISFYKPLNFITPEEAMTVIQGVVQINAYGSLVPVPNTNALIITDKTPVIRKALGLLEFIDVEPAQVVTEFVQLERASSERIVEVLNEMFGTEDSAKANTPAAPSQPQQGGQPGGPETPAAPAAGGLANARYENRLITGKAKFLADKRTNRVLVVTRVENFRYVREVIAKLDSAANFEQPFVRVLNYVPVNDIFSIIGDMLSDAESESTGGTGGGSNSGSTATNPFSNQGGGGSSDTSGGFSSGSGGVSRPDRLSDESQQGTPQAMTIGEIRIIGDNNSNSVIVYGPPEAKLRAKQILDLLDQRPKQVYLAVVIGQLRLDKGVDYGVNYLIRTEGFRPLNNLLGNSDTSGFAATSLAPSILPGGSSPFIPNPANIVNPASLTPALASLAGLSVYGTIADSVDVYARFLESTRRFRTLSRPVVYTTNNRKATILSGQKVPVPTQSLSTATGGGITGAGSSITSNIQYQDVVLKLEVIPLINSDREVNLVIAQTNDNIIGTDTISGNEVPIISTQEITTSVRVPNGNTIVLGGLISEDKELGREGMPYISEIPVIGTLLGGRTQRKNEKRELIVMIQPVVVDSNHDLTKSSAYEADRSPLGRDGMEMTAPLAEQAHPPAVWKPTPLPPEPKKKFKWPWTNDQYD